MRVFSAPAKVNLALHVSHRAEDGFHPLQSLVQTVEWCDRLEVEAADLWSLEIEGADLDLADNLVDRAFEAMGVRRVKVLLEKVIPIEAGLGGGSSDAAAALTAASKFGGDRRKVASNAVGLGADVPFFLDGGTQLMSGRGEQLARVSPLDGFSLAVVVPDIHLSTHNVYARWDDMDGPEGEVVSTGYLPPPLRDSMPVRNDLLPASLGLSPSLGDFMADVRELWGQPVLMTGSGPACFGFFADVGEAEDAAQAVPGVRAAIGVELRPRGVAEEPADSESD